MVRWREPTLGRYASTYRTKDTFRTIYASLRESIEVPPGKTENATWEFDVNRFIEDTVRVYAMGESDRFEVDIDGISYGDGTRVAPAEAVLRITPARDAIRPHRHRR